MLGLTLHDPDGIESAVSKTAGLSLLAVTSRFWPVKSTHQIKAQVVLANGLLAKAKGATIQGYEIHMGQTHGANALRPFRIEQRSEESCSDADGCLSENGNIIGTYIHGLFHNDDLRRGILAELAERKGKSLPPPTASFSSEEQYDRLAAHVSGSLNMDLVHRLLGLQ